MQHETTPNDKQVALPEFLAAMERVHGYRPAVLHSGVLQNSRDADRYEGWMLRTAQPTAGEAVAEVGPGWTLRLVGSTPIVELFRRHPELRIGTKLYTHPAADTLGAVRELVAKWREATGHDDFGCNEIRAQNMAVENCADELESALAQAPAMRVTGTHRYEESGRGWCKHCGYAAHVAEQHGAALGQGNGS